MTPARRRAAAIVLIAIAVTAQLACPPRAAAIGRRTHPRPSHPRGAAPHPRAGEPPTAPSGPPLVSGEGAYAEAGHGESEVQGPPAGSEPLVDNGLGSPLCDGGSALSAAARRNCETSGFVAASAPGIDYELDVHIDTGTLDLTALAESLFQTWLVKRPWNALVWAVHAVLVAIEWSFTIDLLSSPAMGAVATALRDAQRTFTQPWVAGALALGAVLVAWQGIVRGRVAQSVGEAIAILAMMAGGLWMIADPIGTVGAVAGWADLAGVQTLGAVSSGSASRAPATLADSMGQLFGATVNGPWCYLEFGNVGWCEDPARLDSRLRASAIRIAAEKASEAGSAGPSAPGARGAAARSAELLRSAETNGQLFLALPANEPERNSIKEQGSLLSALCQTSTATSCRGPTAAEAEFRTPRGTSDRFVGILLIAAGIVGMLLLFGFLVMRMLGASLLALLLLLAAPVIVLAPAFGDGGRALFKQWAARLFAAAGSKLIWSFLLGVLLVAMRVVLLLNGLGWWVQWLLLCILWWGSFLQRHRILAPASPSGGDSNGLRGVGKRLKRAYDAGHWTWDRVWDHADRAQRRREQERNAPKLPPSKQPEQGKDPADGQGGDRRSPPPDGDRRGPRDPGGGPRPTPGSDGAGESLAGPRDDLSSGSDGGLERAAEADAGEDAGDGRSRSHRLPQGREKDEGGARRGPSDAASDSSDGGASGVESVSVPIGLRGGSRQSGGDGGAEAGHGGAEAGHGGAEGGDGGSGGGDGGKARETGGGGADRRGGERGDREGSKRGADTASATPPGRRVPQDAREQRLFEIVERLHAAGGGESSASESGSGKQSRSALDRQLRERREADLSPAERRRRQFDWEES